jgi:hypothetical protein
MTEGTEGAGECSGGLGPVEQTGVLRGGDQALLTVGCRAKGVGDRLINENGAGGWSSQVRLPVRWDSRRDFANIQMRR